MPVFITQALAVLAIKVPRREGPSFLGLSQDHLERSIEKYSLDNMSRRKVR